MTRKKYTIKLNKWIKIASNIKTAVIDIVEYFDINNYLIEIKPVGAAAPINNGTASYINNIQHKISSPDYIDIYVKALIKTGKVVITSSNNPNSVIVTSIQEPTEVKFTARICEHNTTTTNLGIDGVFTGGWQDTIEYINVAIGVNSDQDSAINGLDVQWSADGINVHDHDYFTISANKSKIFTFQPARRYVRIVYTNGGVATTDFDIETRLSKVAGKSSSHRIQDNIVAEDDAELVKAVLTGENPAGTFVNFQGTSAGNFKTSLEEIENTISDDSNTKLKVSPYVEDEYGIVSRFLGDNMFAGAPIVVLSEHHEIHCGDSYNGNYTGDLANGASIVFSIIVPNELVKRFHLLWTIDVEAEMLVTVHEGATLSNNGTSIPVYNRERNSALVDFLGFNHTPTITTPGTQLDQKRIGSGKSIGGTINRQNELVMKNNTKYTITIANQTTSNNYYNIDINYYVHPGI